MVSKILLLVLLISVLAIAEVIRFTPLPIKPKEKLIGEHIPLVKYLERKTGYRFEIVYVSDYSELLNNLKQGKIDIITAGPLPYVELKKDFSQVQPIVLFKNEEGKTSYTCICFTTSDGPKSLRDVKGPIALTQKLSTCGYFSANILLSSVKRDIKKVKYEHFDTHHEVVQRVLSGEYEMGCVKSTIFKKYEGYTLRVLGKSPEWPEFAIIANTQKLSKYKIQKINDALLSISQEEMKELIEGRYGFAPVRGDEYRVMERYEKYKPDF